MKVFAAPALMAPMAGVTDEPFRSRLKRNGCRAAWTEMISAAALTRKHKATLAMAAPADLDGDLAAQLFGARPAELAASAGIMQDLGWQRLDLNMGCPVRKVIKTGAGAALARDPARAAQCMAALRKNFSGILTIKIRTGWSNQELSYMEMGRIAREEGIDGVTLHGRTRAQLYSGHADWDAIAELADTLAIPVAGNGDITNSSTAINKLENTGVDAVMIGRAALGSPWIFRDIGLALQGLPPQGPPGDEEARADLGLQFKELLQLKGERRAVAEMKKFTAWAAKGLPGAAHYRTQVMATTNADQMRRAIEDLPRQAEPEE